MSDYRVRAKKFLNSVVPYIQDILDRPWEVAKAIERYNHDFNRHVVIKRGAVRIVLVTSDYIVKWDYDSSSASEWGGCISEYNAYLAAKTAGYEYLFAEPTAIYVNGTMFIIMPRIHNIGWHAHEHVGMYDIFDCIDSDASDWVYKHIGDLHHNNWGICKGQVCIIDYASFDDIELYGSC